MKQINFTLNGKPISLEVQGQESLLTIIRSYLEQTGTNSMGPFSTPTATVRGNIINQTNFDHYSIRNNEHSCG